MQFAIHSAIPIVLPPCENAEAQMIPFGVPHVQIDPEAEM